MKLYELPPIWDDLQRKIDDANGELPPDVEAWLDQLNMEIDDKVASTVSYLKNLRAEMDALFLEADALRGRALQRERAIRQLKNYLHVNLQRLGRVKAGDYKNNARLQKNSRPSIAWLGALADLPADLKRVKVELDGDAAYELWKLGNILPDGFSVTVGEHVRIS